MPFKPYPPPLSLSGNLLSDVDESATTVQNAAALGKVANRCNSRISHVPHARRGSGVSRARQSASRALRQLEAPGPVDGQKVKLGIDDDDDAGFKGSVGDSVERPEEFGKVSKTGDVAGVAGLMFTVGVLPPLPLPELAEEVVKFELDFLEGVGDGEGEGGYTCFPFTSLLFSDPLPLVTFTSLLSVPLDQ